MMKQQANIAQVHTTRNKTLHYKTNKDLNQAKHVNSQYKTKQTKKTNEVVRQRNNKTKEIMIKVMKFFLLARMTRTEKEREQ